MKRIKRILCLMLALSMLFTLSVSVLTGCNDNTPGDETTGGAGETTGGATSGDTTGNGGTPGGDPLPGGEADHKITVRSK
ncbi:MAG: hypothetical protein J6B77_08995, partial [Clostridia bacterium]|nr:hypothetical protein [Clostridia bacterium]